MTVSDIFDSCNGLDFKLWIHNSAQCKAQVFWQVIIRNKM